MKNSSSKISKTFKDTIKFLKIKNSLAKSKSGASTDDFRQNSTIIKNEILKKLDYGDCITQSVIGSGFVVSIVLTQDDKYIIMPNNTDILIVDAIGKYVIHTIKDAHAEFIWKVIVTKDSSLLLSCSQDKAIKVWDFESRGLIHSFENAHDSIVHCIILTSDEKHFISCS